jgi:peroxiredoxin
MRMQVTAIAFLGCLVSVCVQANDTGRQLTELPYKPAAPSLALPTTEGDPVDIRQLRQAVIVVHFWASWCRSCVSELRAMHNTAAELRSKDVVVLAVNLGDNVNLINHFFDEYRPAYKVLVDGRSTSAGPWQIVGLPTTYVIGPDRKIHYGAVGTLAWESRAVVRAMLDLCTVTD